MNPISIQQQIRQKFQIVPTALHLTRIENLEGICREQGIHAKNRMTGKRYTDISSASVQAGRASKVIPQTGKPLHDYVPLFFSFKAPMVASLQSQNEDLVYLQIHLDVFTRPARRGDR